MSNRTAGVYAMRLAAGAFAVLFLLSQASAYNENVGTTGFGSLKIGVSARPAALGGAFVAVTEDINALVWNPAALVTLNEGVGIASYANYFVDTQLGFLAMARPLGTSGTLGFGITYMSYGELRKTDRQGEDLGTFRAGDLTFRASMGRFVWKDRLAVGAGVKAIYSRIDEYSSDAYAFDVGALGRLLTDRTTLGASALNMGFVRSSFEGDKDALPTQIKAGVMHRLAHMPLTVVVDFTLPNDNDPYFSVGGEFAIGENLYLRPGYSSLLRDSGDSSRNGISAGAGFVWQKIRIDYAFSSFEELGDVHRISLSGAM